MVSLCAICPRSGRRLCRWFLEACARGNRIDVLDIVGSLGQRSIRGAEGTRRIAGLRIVNVRRSHDIPFGATSFQRGETDFVFAAKARR
jgi:hypothetical protein